MYFAKMIKNTVCLSPGLKKEFDLEVNELLEFFSCAERMLYERSIFIAALMGKIKWRIRSCIKNSKSPKLTGLNGYKYREGEVKYDSYEWGRNTNMKFSEQLLQG